MNYYEELGVSAAASTEQIRHSYKGLARLLHPDQIQDENLKPLAALQMRRLNQILSVLTDPEERRRYDNRLRAPAATSVLRPKAVHIAPVSDRQWLRPITVGLIAWLPPIAGLIIFVAAVISYGAGGREVAPISAPESVTAPSSLALPVRPLSALASPTILDPEKLASDLKTAQRELEVLRAKHQKALDQLALNPQPASREEILFEAPPAAGSPAPEAKPLTAALRAELPEIDRPSPAPWKFSGHWYYVPERRLTPSKGLYLPEYIELWLTEDAGSVYGRYRARYRVTDQAISPEVFFHFEGAGSLPITQLPWTGPGAAKGKVTLQLLSADQLEVDWTASQLSAELNLASGSARLIRQKEQR